MSETRVEPGAELFSVATGRLSIWRKRSRQAIDFMAALDGLVAVHQVADGRMLWLFATENDAMRRPRESSAARTAAAGRSPQTACRSSMRSGRSPTG